MKITFVTPSMNFGGAERVMSLLANQWVNNDIQVDFIILNDEQGSSYLLDNNIGIFYMQSPIFNKWSNFPKLIRMLRSLLKKSRPDVVISFFSSTLVFSWLALIGTHTPLIYSERNDPNNNIKGFKAKAFQWLSLRCSKKLVFQIAGARDYYSKGIRKKGEIILNPFDTANLPDSPLARTKTLVSVGRLCEQKNQAMQIRAFQQVVEKYPEYRLEIYGDGSLRDALENLVISCGLKDKVELKGAHKDVLRRINSAEIFLFSSGYEGLPNAVIEAMALGLPCVCTKCSPGGAEALIENYKNGVLVEVDDADQMAKEVIRLIESPSEREQIGLEAKKIVDRLGVKLISRQWIEVIKAIV